MLIKLLFIFSSFIKKKSVLFTLSLGVCFVGASKVSKSLIFPSLKFSEKIDIFGELINCPLHFCQNNVVLLILPGILLGVLLCHWALSLLIIVQDKDSSDIPIALFVTLTGINLLSLKIVAYATNPP